MRSRLARRAAAVALPALLGIPLAAHAAAQNSAYPPRVCALAVNTATVLPGESIRVTGTGFSPDTTITVWFRSPAMFDLGSSRTNAAGYFSLISVIPETASLGAHQIQALPGAACATAVTTVTSSDDGLGTTRPARSVAASSTSSLPASTGENVALGVAVGGALIAAGIVFVVGARRRRE